MKKDITPDEGTDAFSGFPVVLCSVGGEKDNIITLALCHVFSFKPPLVGIGVSPKRFSYGLLEKSKDFAVNIPTRAQLKVVEVCGSKSGRRVDKFQAAGLTKEKASRISSPLIAECPVNLECVKIKKLETGDHDWFIGEVVASRREESYDKADMLLYWGDYRVIGDKVG
jgi:flavin reductase (DIM6/NTAB) family NADH-FMN oxidoreductase RutF